MTCPTMDAERLGAYLDGELDLTSALALERHLSTCADCARALAAQRALSAALGAADLRYRPAPELRDRLRQSLRRAAPRPAAARLSGFSGPRRRALMSLAALLAVAVASWSLGRFGPGFGIGGTGEPAIPQEVVASHVRSLLAGHPEDVVSTDRHTVKPWFAGKLDYAPQVVDLAGQGYPLEGGRLDYLDGRPVAALVYRAGRHPINLFTWPAQDRSTGSTTRPETGTRRGFHLVHWTQDGMTYWAVSDLAADQLDAFRRRLAGAIEREKGAR
ncbi:MAG TPA: anti-sigma factor [Thermoanaerobaculia bacterium]